MRRIGIALALVGAGVSAAAAAGQTAPSLRVVRHSPLVVRGTDFYPAEKVTVRASQVVRVVHSSATGTFHVRVGPLPTDRCSLGIVAVGSLGDRARIPARAMCPPARAP